MAARRRGKYYLYGYIEGQNAANDTDWQPGEMIKAYEKDDLGEIVGQILQNWQQMAGTIYYDDGVTENQLSAFEDGFYDGFANEVKNVLRKKSKA